MMRCPAGMTAVEGSRYLKTGLFDWTSFEHVAYLDADTVVHQDLQVGFAALDDGFDLALCASRNQGDELLWHVGVDDRRETLAVMGCSEVLQLQAGVFFVARNARTQALFAAWRSEWARFRGQDQGALLRALRRVPVRIWLLGQPFNGGAVIAHHFGELRDGA
ncbi:MAG TPA: hypothetical protein PKD09_17785 [Aggregatilinea sp.]|uniref:hypothetical protein n=1 Tax=Aggregatilinea sp. TaxID=2806333 RepID=UPI002BBDC48C|nr:hypothetical protein [Aggregatilinea sp.]HML23512.1 hypothetical protein [Aggregatilinea sp.]